jgi:hypothetical protein
MAVHKLASPSQGRGVALRIVERDGVRPHHQGQLSCREQLAVANNRIAKVNRLAPHAGLLNVDVPVHVRAGVGSDPR